MSVTTGSPKAPFMASNVPEKKDHREIVWYNVFILMLWHLGALYTLVRVIPKSTWTDLSVLWMGMWLLSGLGITAGAHRLWAHRSYQASPVLQVFLLFANTIAFQGSVFEWSRDHRVHHKGSETNADPHNARRGFFFAHCGWVMVRKHPEVIATGKKLNCDDLASDPLVMFQAKFYLPLVLVCCYGVPTLVGHFFLSGASTGFWIGGIFRHVWVLHMTWCVNSVAHLFGNRPYQPSINPAENLFVSICALGEGWHNYHHKYPRDYATGEWGILSGQWNPTKLFIDACALVGLAHDLKRSKTARITREKIAATAAETTSKASPSKASPSRKWTDQFLGRFFFGRSADEMF